MTGLYSQGLEALEQHNYKKAIDKFLQAIQWEDHTNIHLSLGQAYFFSDQPAKAIPHLERYIAPNLHKMNTIYALDLMAQCYAAYGQLDLAEIWYKNAITLYPEFASPWHNRGLLHMQIARIHEGERPDFSKEELITAQSYLNKALELCSTMPQFLHSMASWYEQYAQFLENTMEYNEQLDKSIEQHFGLAFQYYREAFDKCHQDDTAFRNIITSNLNECFVQYGHYFYRQARYADAQHYYGKALVDDLCHITALTQMGMCYSKQKNYDKALEYFLKVSEITTEESDIADAFLNLAFVYRCKKDWINAELAITKALNMAPNNKDIKDEQDKLNSEKPSVSAVTHGIFRMIPIAPSASSFPSRGIEPRIANSFP